MIYELFDEIKGTYPEKVNIFMREMKRTMKGPLPGTKPEQEENPVLKYDYDSYCLKKRVEGTLKGRDEAHRRFSNMMSVQQIDTSFAFVNSLISKGGYNYDVDRMNSIAVSAAIWILDELLLSGKIKEIYQYLPDMKDVIDFDSNDTIFMPTTHPIYQDDIIMALVTLIRHRNTSKPFEDFNSGSLIWKEATSDSDEKSLKNREAFNAILALLNPNSVNDAVRRYEDKVWEFYGLAFSFIATVEKKRKDLEKEINDLMRLKNKDIKNTNVFKPNNVLQVPNNDTLSFMEMFSTNSEARRRWNRIQMLEREIKDLEQVTLTELSLPNDREKLVKSLKGILSDELIDKVISFHVDDPFESAFALLYLFDTNSIIPWYYFGSISVAYSLCDQLPYDMGANYVKNPILLSDFNSVLYQHRYKGYRYEGRTDAGGEPVQREKAKNLSQLIFSNTLSLFPRVVPKQIDMDAYLNEFGELTDHEKEAYELLSYALVTGMFRTHSLTEHRSLRELEKILEDSSEEEEMVHLEDGKEEQLAFENKRLRQKNKELVEKVRDIITGKKEDSEQIQQLQHQMDIQEKELADLREALYLQKNDDIDMVVDNTIQYPFATSGRIVSFGGHESWRKEMCKRLPNVIFVSPDTLPNIDLIRNADAIWLQVNCLSHADFFRIINIVRQHGIPLRYFSYSGVEKCAEQMVNNSEN